LTKAPGEYIPIVDVGYFGDGHIGFGECGFDGGSAEGGGWDGGEGPVELGSVVSIAKDERRKGGVLLQ